MAEIRRVRATDAAAWKALRLEALADTPLAFGVSLAESLTFPDERWVERVTTGATADDTALFLAFDGTDPIAMMGSYYEVEDSCWVLISVYVTPAHRGTDLATRMHEAVIDRVRASGGLEIYLEVWGGNPRAQAFYERLGYRLTGKSRPHDLDGTQIELEMLLPLQ